MGDFYYNAVPPHQAWDDLDEEKQREYEACRDSWADFIVEMALEEAQLRRAEKEKK